MGCDIHSICEVKEDGIWKVNPIEIFPQERWNDQREKISFLSIEPETNRWYRWFSVLAHVRNYIDLPTISERKGVPDNATDEWKEYVERWGGDLHSISYISVEEFINFDWEQLITVNAFITFENYKVLKGTKKEPLNYNTYINRSNNEFEISEEEAELIISEQLFHITDTRDVSDMKIKHISECNLVIDYEWEEPLRKQFEEKFKSIINPMKKLREQFEDVRLMIGFDN